LRDGPAGPGVVAFATQGPGTDDEQRIRELLELVSPELWPFDRRTRIRSCLRLLRKLARSRPDLVVMEGTGVAGGASVLAARMLLGIRYVVSSGDAVGPFVGAHHPALGPLAAAYERTLCRLSAGFVGWSPYLVGRALTLGARRAMTAAGWAPEGDYRADRAEARRELGLPEEAVVFGLVGSLVWNPHVEYCYGSELVRAIRKVSREDIRVLIAGDGTGADALRELAGPDLGRRVILLGRVPRERVPKVLSAIDVGSLPQSVDGVGSFRLTTKLSEYLAAGVPIVTGQLPLAYDLDDGYMWRLPGDAPWDPVYLRALQDLMEGMDHAKVAERRAALTTIPPLFQRSSQQRRMAEFIRDLHVAGGDG
jgi:hypothetical protein